MPCTTILVGRGATYDGSTFVARNEDSGSGQFTAKKFIVVTPQEQPRHYQSVISKVEIDLPDNPMRYTAVPNALNNEGIWGEAGVNEANVSMTATETITSNERVLGADPLVKGGIGEEDLVTIVLPYIHSAREGVERLGMLHERYGTYEMNGIGIQDVNEVWWFETIGGHHWIAKRVPDNAYVVMPNQQGISSLDLTDAFGDQKDNMCSKDLREFIEKNHLDLTMDEEKDETDFDVRAAFGSHADSDHTYNTPRAWFMLRYLNPNTYKWDGPDAEFTPDDDDLPWSLVPEHKITVEDVKYVLSAHYQGTPFDPYGHYGDSSRRGEFRPIGINRNNFVSLVQLRPYMPKEIMAVQWLAFGSNVFNAFVPFYANVETTPQYLSGTGATVTTDNFYWANRLIGALADAHWSMCNSHIERYQNAVQTKGHQLIHEADDAFAAGRAGDDVHAFLAATNETIADMARENTDDLLDKVLYEASCEMRNKFSRSDA
ncbi:MAG: C69 family dipeptidase [Lachnospiraceae bacterium]|nr:C69 family dipeptidase [Lachnospiraceae bacterium]